MGAITGTPRVFRDARAILAESIVWNPAGDLFWCDITAGVLFRSPADGPIDGSTDAAAHLPPPLASFAPAPALPGFVVSLGNRIVLTGSDGIATTVLAEIRHAHDGIRLNEGKCDPFGRWVTGSMDVDGKSDCAIYSIDDSGVVRTLVTGLGTANGFEWSPDGATMYYTDTSAETIYRGAYSSDGELSGVEVFHQGEMHDGLAMDSAGFLWSGINGSARVVRYTPDGIEDEVIHFPAPGITSVAFGGPDLSTLFVGSARENLTDEQLREFPLSGAIFAVDTAVTGSLPRTFGTRVAAV